jgi:acyl-ACP thioesterase
MNYKRNWIDTYQIHSYEADVTARATASALLQFMQESAWNHAEHLELGYSHLVKKNLAWVMARLSLHIKTLPKWHETITLNTFPSGRDKLFAYRDFRITSQKDDVLAIGTTTWLVIDINRRRPQRTDTYFHINDWGEYERSYPGFAPKVDAFEAADSTTNRRVHYSHLDVNGHLNNVKYLDFVLDSFSPDFRAENDLVELDMNFTNEALLGDQIKIQTFEKDGDFLHALYRDAGQTELCRLKTVWAKKC